MAQGASHNNDLGGRDIKVPKSVNPWLAGFTIKKAPTPWRKIWGTALTTTITLATGIALGHLVWGIWGFMGGFTSLYVTNDPYPKRAVLLFFVALGLTVAMGLGALSSVWWEMTIALGFVGFAATFLTGVFSVPLPAGFMFILEACISAAIPHPSDILLRMLFVFYGGMVAWVVGMIRWPFSPRAPEQKAVHQVYIALASYIKGLNVSGESLVVQTNKTAEVLRTAEAAMSVSAKWNPHNAITDKLIFLMDRAEIIFQEALVWAQNKENRVPQGVVAHVQSLGEGALGNTLDLPAPADTSSTLEEVVRHTWSQLKNEEYRQHPISRPSPPNWVAKMQCAWSFESLVLISSLRMTIAIVVSILLAYALGEAHPYWVPLTVGAVLQGPTILVMTQRAVQRAVGTTIGLFVAGIVMANHPTGLATAGLVLVFQIIMLLFIAKNYGISVIFITGLALMIIEASAHLPPLALIIPRFEDTLLGVVMGMAALFLLWPRMASARVPVLLQKTMIDEGDLLTGIVNHGSTVRRMRQRVLADILNLQAAVDNALGEVPRPSNVKELWIEALAVKKAGYYLLGMKRTTMASLNQSKMMMQFGHVFQVIGQAVGGNREIEHNIKIPDVPELKEVSGELRSLVQSLQHHH